MSKEKRKAKKSVRKSLNELIQLRIEQAKTETDPNKRQQLDDEIKVLIIASKASNADLLKTLEMASNFAQGMSSIGAAIGVANAGHVEAMNGVIDTFKEGQKVKVNLLNNIGKPNK